MKPFSLVAVLVITTCNAWGAVRYVAANSLNPAAPYLNWATAATSIQQAVDVAAVGDQILVTNGIYQTGGRVMSPATLTNRLVVDKRVAVRSMNGPAFTVIRGYRVPSIVNGDSAVRCVYLVNGATLTGFTLTEGATRGPGVSVDYQLESSAGGAWCESSAAVLSNCVVTGNSATYVGGGVLGGTLVQCTVASNSAGTYGGGSFQGILNRCTLLYNSAYDGGGVSGGMLDQCTLSGNSATYGGAAEDSMLTNCVVSGNVAGVYGGGALACVMDLCTIVGNQAGSRGGGVWGGTLNNCLLTGNTANSFRGGGGGASGGVLNYCTITGNSSAGPGRGTIDSTLTNCIVYLNGSGLSTTDDTASSTLTYCCTGRFAAGEGNFVKNPLFVDWLNGNFRLQSNSPCINAGINTDASAGLDLDGNPRISGGTVDIGAYELPAPASAISYAWLQEYGMPIDGSADNVDSDGDGMNNWQEWQARTVPIDPESVFRMLRPEWSATEVLIRWKSVGGQAYFLERSTNIGPDLLFQVMASNIAGQAETTAYADTNAFGAKSFFYRVGVHR